MGAWLSRLLAKLSRRQLAALTGALFVVDLLLPDPVPVLDEALLGLLTFLLARRRPPAGP